MARAAARPAPGRAEFNVVYVAGTGLSLTVMAARGRVPIVRVPVAGLVHPATEREVAEAAMAQAKIKALNKLV